MVRACSVMSNFLWPPWTIHLQAPLSMKFSRQEHWSGSPLPSPRDLLHPRIGPRSPHWQMGSTAGSTWAVCCACTQRLWFCLSLWDPMDCSPPGSSVHGLLQARILEWVAMPSSRESSQPKDQTHVSCISCIAVEFFTHWTMGKPAPIWTSLQIWIS